MLSRRMSAAIVAALFAIPALVLGQSQSRPDPKRYDRQVQAFLDADKTNPPAACQILFVGSASISGWRTIKEDLAPNPVFARGLGASTVADQLYYFDKIVTRMPQDWGASLAGIAGGFCDAEHRADAEAFFNEKMTKLNGGPRTLAQTLEGIALCEAQNSARQASVSAFLKKY